MALKSFIHATAIVDPKVKLKPGTKVWAFAQIRERVVMGRDCMIGNGVYIDAGIRVGNRVNIHNKALLYRNMTVQDDVFIGPGVCFVNDPSPRSNVIRKMKGLNRVVKQGASIGANACILSDINIGRYAMVGAGAVVSKDVPDYGLVYGIPAKLIGFVSPKGNRLEVRSESPTQVILRDPRSKFRLKVARSVYDKIRR